MPRKKKCKVFISYSRHDETLVRPLAGLLGAAAEDAVFLDVNSLKPGDLWKTGIETAVRDCSVFILCWCCDSAQSEFVKHEIDLALQGTEKNLVPVLLCSILLPASLADRQWVDLRGRVIHSCRHKPAEPLIVPEHGEEVIIGRSAPGIHQSRSWLIGVGVPAALILFTGVTWLVVRPGRVSVPNHATLPPVGKGSVGVVIEPPAPPSAPPRPSLSPIIFVILLAAIGLSFICLKWWQRARKRRHPGATTVAAIATAYFKNLGNQQT